MYERFLSFHFDLLRPRRRTTFEIWDSMRQSSTAAQKFQGYPNVHLRKMVPLWRASSRLAARSNV